MNLDYIFVEEEATDAEVEQVFLTSDIFILPRVNKKRVLIDLHFKK